jgi:peptide/nickel transport system permease protein
VRSSRWKGWGPAFWVAAGFLVLVLLSAVFGPLWPVDPNDQDLSASLIGPSWGHLLGANKLGQDMLALIIAGARVSVIVGLAATAIGMFLGGILGLVAGYFRGGTDRVIVVVLDAAVAFPALVLALAVVLYWGQNLRNVTIVVGVLTAPLFARVLRTATMGVVDREYVLAARMLGARHRRVIERDIGPNVAVPLLAYGLSAMGFVILIEGALSFFGLGVPEGTTSWGKLVAQGQFYLEAAPWVCLFPAIGIFLTILALNYVGDRVQSRWLFGGPVPKPPKRSKTAATTPTVESAAPVPATAEPGVLLDVVDLHTYLTTPWGVVRAVDGVSLQVRRGRMLAIVGESGSGKTMLARSIAGLVPSPPATPGLPGVVRFEGVDLRTRTPEELRHLRGREISMVFQDPMTSLDPVMKIGQQVAEPAIVHFGLSRKQAKAHALALLRDVGIPDPERRYDQYAHQLSGGLRQRVAIAIALSCGPKLLIADEPTSALDVTVQAQILDLLQFLQRDRNMAVILITHDLGVVAGRADEVIVMYGGQVVERSSTLALFEQPRMPYTAALLASVPVLAAPSHTPLQAIDGAPPSLLFPPPGCRFAPRCGFVQDRCLVELPPLQGDAHQAACWYPLGPPEVRVVDPVPPEALVDARPDKVATLPG